MRERILELTCEIQWSVDAHRVFKVSKVQIWRQQNLSGLLSASGIHGWM